MHTRTRAHTHTTMNIGFLQLPNKRQPGLGSSPQLLSVLDNAPHSFMLTALYILQKKKEEKKRKQKPKNPLISYNGS